MIRRVAKLMILGLCWIATAPLWLTEKALRSVAGRDVCFVTHSEILSCFPGKLGRLLRNAYYNAVLESCPFHVCLQFGCLFAYSRVRIGRNVYLGLHSKVGLVDIGEGTVISDDVQLISGAYQHAAAGFPYAIHMPEADRTDGFQRDPEPRRVTIGRHTWIGTRAIVMADVGDNCAIGAGAVVTRPIPSNSVAVGSPARVIRKLSNRAGLEIASIRTQADDKEDTAAIRG